MKLFNEQVKAIEAFIEKKNNEGIVEKVPYIENTNWPKGMKRSVVLKNDTAIELGNPLHDSTSFLIWKETDTSKDDNTITVVGKDIQKLRKMPAGSFSFGKVVIVTVAGFTTDNCYERYREMEDVRFDLDLKGYMMRAVSQLGREWSRISEDAVENGFSFSILGSSLIDKLKLLDYVASVDIIFITSGTDDIRELKKESEKAMTVIRAMNKMYEEMSFDCDVCDYIDVCSEVLELREMKKTLGEDKSVH